MSLGVAGCNEAVNRYVEKLSGYEAGEGLEMLSWVVMGLQEPYPEECRTDTSHRKPAASTGAAPHTQGVRKKRYSQGAGFPVGDRSDEPWRGGM